MYSFELDARGYFNYQPACRNAVVGDFIWLIYDDKNEYDVYAIKIIKSNGDVLGYIPREESEEIYNLLKLKNVYYCAKVAQIEINKESEFLPWIFLYISKNKMELPFTQEEKFPFECTLMQKSNQKIGNDGLLENQEDDSKNLILGVLFIVGLICIAKIISML